MPSTDQCHQPMPSTVTTARFAMVAVVVAHTCSAGPENTVVKVKTIAPPSLMLLVSNTFEGIKVSKEN